MLEIDQIRIFFNSNKVWIISCPHIATSVIGLARGKMNEKFVQIALQRLPQILKQRPVNQARQNQHPENLNQKEMTLIHTLRSYQLNQFHQKGLLKDTNTECDKQIRFKILAKICLLPAVDAWELFSLA